MRRFLLLAVCLSLLVAPAIVMGQGQGSALVTGKVTDDKGNPLPGANVLIGDYDIGAATDVKGKFSFRVPAQYVKGQKVEITARFIGYHAQTKEITLNPGTINVDFSLSMDVLDLDAIIVTGVSERTPKKLLPFTVSRVSEQEIQTVPEQTPLQSLRGKVAGVDIVQGSGEPGTGQDIKIRGAVNIGSGNGPLIIVDGVILDASSQVDIDPMDIESIEVVKGAAGAAIYGSRAANGVIFIKTRRGDYLATGETRIRVRSEYGINQFPWKADDFRSAHHEFKLTADGKYFADNDGNPINYRDQYKDNPDQAYWMEYKEAVLDVGEGVDPSRKTQRVFQDNPWPIPTYDQAEQFFDPGNIQRHYFELSRRWAAGNLLLSYGRLHEPGVIDGVEGYKRNNFRLNMDQRLTDNLKMGLTAYYMNSWRDNPRGTLNPFYSLMFMSPMANLLAKDPNDGTPYRIDPDPKSLEENPLYASHNQDIDYNRRGLNADLSIDWSPFTWMSLNGHVGFDRLSRFNTRYYFKGFKSIDMQNYPTGHYERFHSFDESMTADITGRVFKDFGLLSTKHTFRWHYESEEYQETYAAGDNLAVNGVKDLGIVNPDEDVVDSWQSEIRSVGYYWESAFNYAEKYLLNVLLRYDGSSLFGPDERWHLYYRVGTGWRMTMEPWWFIDEITEFKLRAAYGTAGSRPGFSAQYETFNVTAGSITKGALGNKKLKPAFSQELEIGLDMAILDRISVELSYSNRKTDDQILSVPLPAFMGYTSQTRNAGALESKTFEGAINARLIQRRDMSWDFSVNFSRTRETITKLDAPPWRTGAYAAFYMREGEEHGAMYGYRWLENKKDLTDLSKAYNINYNPNAFQVNDDGYLVPVGEGNSWKDGPGPDGKVGTADDLWGTLVTVGTDANGDPIQLPFGIPVKYARLNEEGRVEQFVKIGRVLPDFSTNFSTRFRWKGFQFYALVSAMFGGNIYNGTRQWCYRELRHKNVDQAGKPEYKKKPIFYYSTLYDVNRTNKEFVEDGTYLKLRELNLSYRFDKNQLQSISSVLGNVFNSITLGVIGRNLITITDYSGFDPEVGGVEYRVDNFQYPHFRQFTFFVEFEL